MGSDYLQEFLEFRHVGPRVDFVDFLSGVENYYKLLNYTHLEYILIELHII